MCVLKYVRQKSLWEMGMKDEIISELWKIKDEMAKQADYDLKKLYNQLTIVQRSSSHPVVNRVGKQRAASAHI